MKTKTAVALTLLGLTAGFAFFFFTTGSDRRSPATEIQMLNHILDQPFHGFARARDF